MQLQHLIGTQNDKALGKTGLHSGFALRRPIMNFYIVTIKIMHKECTESLNMSDMRTDIKTIQFLLFLSGTLYWRDNITFRRHFRMSHLDVTFESDFWT